MTPLPLWRNRDFMLLQAGHLLSSLGGQLTTIAFPLLVLAVTGSPAKVGLATFASFRRIRGSQSTPAVPPLAGTGSG